jgi:hypothetical protein
MERELDERSRVATMKFDELVGDGKRERQEN